MTAMTRSRSKAKKRPLEEGGGAVITDANKGKAAKKATARMSSNPSSKKKKTEKKTKVEQPVPEPQPTEVSYNVQSTLIGTREWAGWTGDRGRYWAVLFPIFGPRVNFITPRMAAILFNEAIIVGDEFNFLFDSRLNQIPAIARSCFRHSHVFRTNFVACFERIIRRLHKGVVPTPNCVGEMLAMDLIIQNAKEEAWMEDMQEYVTLPATVLDTCFDMVCNGLMPSAQDQLVLQILGEASEDTDMSDYEYGLDGRPWYSWSSNGPSPLDDRPQDMLAYAQNKVAYFPTHSCTGKLTLIHPGKWFVAFSESEMQNHL